MIIAIGEILADMIGCKEAGVMTFKAFCGGAPFNVAVAAHRAGAAVCFVGRVGDDPMGRFVTEEAKKADFAELQIQQDPQRNTTLAFVTLTEGERDFAFNRHDTADYHIDLSQVAIHNPEVSIVHLGSLMLSEEAGQKLAAEVVQKARAFKKTLSFDINFRTDIYGDFEQAKAAYAPYIQAADILKFSDDELALLTGKDSLEAGIQALNRPDALILVTLGSQGSAYFYGEISGRIPSVPVKPVDTTGAGDAFFGTFLACMEGKTWTKANIEQALNVANQAGAQATQFLGAVQL